MNKTKQLFLGVFLLLIVITLGSSVNANQLMTSHSLVEFRVNSPVTQEIIIFESPVYVTKTTVNQENIFYNIEYDNYAIAKLAYVTINGGNPQMLNANQIMIMDERETSAVLQFHLDADIIWQPPGEYYIDLIPQETTCQTIRVRIVIGEYVQITRITPTLITITANQGPGIYRADSSVTVAVDSNHPHWRLGVVISDLKYVDSDIDVVIGTTEMLMAINSEDNYQPLAVDTTLVSSSGLIVPANNFSDELVRLYFAADIGWHHRAGKYEGEISVTLEPIEVSQTKYRFR